MASLGRQKADREEIRLFFEPESVAVVGASRSADKVGNRILGNLLHLGYQGDIFPVNPNADQINGLKSYPSLGDIPGEVELAVVAVPNLLVPEVMRDCGHKRIKGVVIVSSGFNEVGEKGVELQREVLQIATEAGIRIVGPNTTGIVNADKNFTTSWIRFDGGVRKGPVAFIAQTGIFAGVMLELLLDQERLGVSKVAGLGNKWDVDEVEILDYLAQDAGTRVIAVYIEGVKDGRAFFQKAREVAREKPIILLKGGSTDEGARAALSHTGALAGKDAIFDAALKQAGVVRATELEQLIDLAKIFVCQPLPRGNRVALLTNSGGAGVLASDACVKAGLSFAGLSPQSLQKLQKMMPPWARPGHPLDLQPLSEQVGWERAYELALEVALAEESVDCCLLIIPGFREFRFPDDYLARIREAHPEKPASVCLLGARKQYDRLGQILEGTGLPVYPTIQRAVNSLAALCNYSRYREFLNQPAR